MVKEIEGNGNYFRDVFQSLGVDRADYRSIVLKRSDPSFCEDESAVLEKLRNLPELSESSFLLSNVISADRQQVEVIFVPKDCPRLMPDKYPETNELPPADQSYLVETFKDGDPRVRRTIIVLAYDPDGAAKIAKRIVGAKVPYPHKRINAQALLVPPCEWVETARMLIDEGQHLPGSILRFAGLKEYQRQRDKMFGVNVA